MTDCLLPGVRGVESTLPLPAASHCPACGSDSWKNFYRQESVPLDSFRLVESRQAGKDFPRGSLDLAACEDCGFIWNTAFDPAVQDYSAVFEETQWFSGRFQAFGRALVQRLIDRYDLHGKQVMEIGCGPGHFLSLVCEMGDNSGIGLDPFFVENAAFAEVGAGNVKILKEYFDTKHAPLMGDLVICRHTLEHIQPVGDLLRLIREALGDRHGCVLFFEVPDMRHILRDAAFWQIYYEHCSYFTAGSLARLCRANGFEVGDVYLDFDDQYVIMDGYPAEGQPPDRPFPAEETVEELLLSTERFAETLARSLARWKEHFDRARRNGQKVVLWGGAPQSVAFSLAVGVEDEVEHIVNINPVQQGKFAVGTGQAVVAPSFLKDYRPDIVVLMNHVYREEISRSLKEMGVPAKVLSV